MKKRSFEENLEILEQIVAVRPGGDRVDIAGCVR